MNASDFRCELGCIRDDAQPGATISLTASDFELMVALIGPTGMGKSRVILQMTTEHRRWRRGFCLIGPGDESKDFLGLCAAEILLHRNHALLPKIHYVNLNPTRMARYDALKLPPLDGIHPELQ